MGHMHIFEKSYLHIFGKNYLYTLEKSFSRGARKDHALRKMMHSGRHALEKTHSAKED